MAYNDSKKPRDQTHRTLRLVSAVSAAFGIDINVITMIVVQSEFNTKGPLILMVVAFIPLIFSILWSFADVYSDRLWKGRVPAGLYVLVDGIGFLSFVTLLVVNGIILGDLNVNVGNRRVILLTYNSLPWAVCAIVHLSVVLRSILHSSELSTFTDLIRPRARCPDCSRTWHRETGEVGGEAGERLLGEDEDEDAEANPKGKGVIRLEDDVEGPSRD